MTVSGRFPTHRRCGPSPHHQPERLPLPLGAMPWGRWLGTPDPPSNGQSEASSPRPSLPSFSHPSVTVPISLAPLPHGLWGTPRVPKGGAGGPQMGPTYGAQDSESLGCREGRPEPAAVSVAWPGNGEQTVGSECRVGSTASGIPGGNPWASSVNLTLPTCRMGQTVA